MSGQNADVLDYLRAQFARLDARFDRTDRVIGELSDRISHLETGVVALRRDTTEFFAQLIAVGHRIDALSRNVERIEARLELVNHS